MSLSKLFAATLVAVGLSIAAATPARAALVSFDVDPAQSYGRITIPDFNYTVDVLGTINVRPRNYNVNNNNAWTDAGGRLAPLDGTISTNLVDGVSVQFNSGLNNLFAVETFNARPNPAVFNGTTYTNTTTDLAAFATNIRTNNFLASQLGLLAIRDTQLDIASGVIPLGGGTSIAGSATNLGLSSAQIGADFVGLAASAIDDVLQSVTSDDLFGNTGAGSITVVDFLTRKLTLAVNLPLVFDLGDGVIINGNVQGQIVAYATLVPEPSTVAMAGVAALGLCFAGRRRFRRS